MSKENRNTPLKFTPLLISKAENTKLKLKLPQLGGRGGTAPTHS
jgi:hypothetical protein